MNACFYYYFEYHLHYGIKQSNWGIKIYFTIYLMKGRYWDYHGSKS